MSKYNNFLLLVIMTTFIVLFSVMSQKSFYHSLETRNDALVIQNTTKPSTEVVVNSIPLSNAMQTEESIMIPVQLKQASDGTWQWSNSLFIDEVDSVLMMILSPKDSHWKVTVAKESSDLLLDGQFVQDQLDPASHFGNRYLSLYKKFENIHPGIWTIEITSSAFDPNKHIDGYLIVANKDLIKMQEPFLLVSALK